MQALWAIVSAGLFTRPWCPMSARVRILRMFGATVGDGVRIRSGVRVHWPWKLVIGDDVWIGVDAWLLNLEAIDIGSDVCISQQVLLCTGSHDARSSTFEFDNAPIIIEDGVWVATRATVLKGVTVGSRSVIGATALVTRDVPPNATVLAPASQLKSRRSK